MKDLPEKTLCPYETTQLVCVVDSAAISWRIVSLSVTLAFAVVNDVDKFISNVTFFIIPNSRTGRNSSLSFIVNSTLNSLVISCYDTSVVVFTAQCQNLITLNITCKINNNSIVIL